MQNYKIKFLSQQQNDAKYKIVYMRSKGINQQSEPCQI